MTLEQLKASHASLVAALEAVKALLPEWRATAGATRSFAYIYAADELAAALSQAAGEPSERVQRCNISLAACEPFSTFVGTDEETCGVHKTIDVGMSGHLDVTTWGKFQPPATKAAEGNDND